VSRDWRSRFWGNEEVPRVLSISVTAAGGSRERSLPGSGRWNGGQFHFCGLGVFGQVKSLASQNGFGYRGHLYVSTMQPKWLEPDTGGEKSQVPSLPLTLGEGSP